MYPLKQQQALFNHILWLDRHQQENPSEVLQYFAGAYELSEVRLLLHQLVQIALTTNNQAFQQAGDRQRLVRVMEDVEAALEAIKLLHNKQTADRQD